MIRVNSIAIRYFQIIFDLDIIDDYIFTAQHVKAPVWSRTESDVADFKVITFGKDENFRPPLVGYIDFSFLAVMGHEFESTSIDTSCTGNLQVFNISCDDHSVVDVVFRVCTYIKFSITFEMEINTTLEL